MNLKILHNLSAIILIISIFLTILFIWNNSYISKEESMERNLAIYEYVVTSFDKPINREEIIENIIKVKQLLSYMVLGIQCDILVRLVKRKNLIGNLLLIIFIFLIAILERIIYFAVHKEFVLTSLILSICGFALAIFINSLVVFLARKIKDNYIEE